LNVIEKKLGRVVGNPCWGVDWGSYIGLVMNFGKPHLFVLEPKEAAKRRKNARRLVHPRGEWELRVLIAHWKLSLRDFGPVTGASSLRQIRMGISRLRGQELTAISVAGRNAFSRLSFDLGAELEVRRTGPTEEGELWTLFSKRGPCLSVRGDGCYVLGETKPKARWRRLPALSKISA